jgi:ABC-type branched-subunit amino acid transport system ATPase component/branched-subunit amino acid ABC-type transport system permease component
VETFLNLTITGAVSGALYSLIACSLVLTYTSTRVFNLAYGAVAYLSAFLYFELTAGLGWPVGVAGAVVIAGFAPALGWCLNRIIFGRLAGASDGPKIMAAVGLLVALPALGRWIVERLIADGGAHLPSGDRVYSLPGLGPTPAKVFHLPFHVILNSDQLIVFAVAALVAVALWVLLRRSRLGLLMRAHVDAPTLAGYRGINGEHTQSITWMLSSALAALAGVIGSPILNSLDANTYNVVLFVAVAAAVVGGLRSIPIAFAGGLLLGIAQTWVLNYATFARDIVGFNSSVPSLLMLGGLLWMGRASLRRAGSAADAALPPDGLADLPVWRRTLPWAVAGALLVAYLLFIADGFWTGLITRGLALSLVMLSFVIVTGLGGMISLAQASFVTVSGLTLGYLVNNGVPTEVAIVAAVAAAVVLGVLCALPALRLDGLSLALATLALAFLGDRVLFAWDSFRNGSTGWTVDRLALGPVDLGDNRTMALFLLALFLVLAWIIGNVQRSASGRAMAAVRSSEAAAATAGLSAATTKLMFFALSAAVAGLGGVMLAMFNQGATNTTTRAETGLLWLATVVLIGVRRPAGAILAGLAVVLSPQIWQEFSIAGWTGHQSVFVPSILFGLGAVSVAKNPEGMIAVTSLRNAARRHARRSAAASVPPEAAPSSAEAASVGAASVGAAPEKAAPVDGAVLAVDGLHSGYGAVAVTHGVDLRLRPGTITALVGANGAGKSTLCATLAGGLVPTAGTVLLGGRDITARPAHWRARHGLVLAPESRGIFPNLDVVENLAVWVGDRREVAAVLERFPALAARRGVPAGNLSGGEQQLLALAPLLVRVPGVLIADEPLLGLAPLVVRQVLEVLTDLRDRGVAVLLVEEKARVLLDIADQVAFLQLGRVVWTGRPDEVEEAELTRAYLGGVAAG